MSPSKKATEDCKNTHTKESWVRPINMDRKHSDAFTSTFIPAKYYKQQEVFR